MIVIAELNETDKGREVCYINYGGVEYGRITSWNDSFIFVRYHLKVMRNGDKQPRYGETSEATSPGDLKFTT